MKCSRQILPQHWSLIIANCHFASMVIAFYCKLIAVTRKLIVIFDGQKICLLFTRNTVIYVVQYYRYENNYDLKKYPVITQSLFYI